MGFARIRCWHLVLRIPALLLTGSSCKRSERAESRIPTTILLRIISCFKLPLLQFSARLCRTVTYCSEDSPSNWLRRLKRALLNITYFLTLKNSSNFPRTSLYSLRSLSVVFEDKRTSSAVSPKQYKSVLTFRSSFSLERPEATLNCSKLRRHFSHWSGCLKSKGSGGLRRMLAILLVQDRCHHVVFIFTNTRQLTAIHTRYL